MRNFENPNRSVVVSRGGMAATSNPSSTLAAINILESGGNAADAAIAAVAVQCVVESGSTGIGGDCFFLYSSNGTDNILAYNGSGRAPAAASIDWYENKNLSKIPPKTPHAVTIPGSVEAWARLNNDHGSMPLRELLKPAINLARNGYPVAPRTAHDWHSQKDLLSHDPNASKIFIPDGKLPQIGDIHYQLELANTLEAIAEDGPRAFYEGEIAADIVNHLHELGGLHTLDDFKNTNGEYVKPIKTLFRGYEIFECPPAGHGIIALMILNILSGLPISEDPLSPDRLHAEIEATRLAYSVRDAVLADPNYSPVPTDWLLSDELASQLRKQINFDHKLKDIPAFDIPEHNDTVYISIVDKNRNSISFINSLFSLYGSGIMSPRTGVLLHNRGEGFTLRRGHPNCIAPSKRPLHTIIPGMMTKNGRVEMSFGVMGGHYQAMGHAHFISKIIDYGYNIQTAMELPRLFPIPGTDNVEVEGTMPKSTITELERRGFKFVAPARPIGGAQAVQIKWDSQTLFGASDPRKDGCALGTILS